MDLRTKTVIEDVEKYLKPSDPDDIDEVRKSVLAQFGPDYCVIGANAAFRMMTSYFLMAKQAMVAPNISCEAVDTLATLHGGVIKEAILGAGFNSEDAIVVLKALCKYAHREDGSGD